MKTNNYLIDLRKMNNLTQVEVAKKLNITQSTVSKIERGLMRLDTELLEQLMKLYGGEDNTMPGPFRSESDYERIKRQIMNEYGSNANPNDYVIVVVPRKLLRKSMNNIIFVKEPEE